MTIYKGFVLLTFIWACCYGTWAALQPENHNAGTLIGFQILAVAAAPRVILWIAKEFWLRRSN